MVDGLGMPGRSKAYHDVTYRNLGDGGSPTISPPSGNSATATRPRPQPRRHLRPLGRRLRLGARDPAFPDFYKVCVSSAGNHDHRLDKAGWVERYMGLPVGDHYASRRTIAGAPTGGQAAAGPRRAGRQRPPASTLLLVDALITANKDFDLLIVPNRPHFCGYDPYFVRALGLLRPASARRRAAGRLPDRAGDSLTGRARHPPPPCVTEPPVLRIRSSPFFPLVAEWPSGSPWPVISNEER